MEQCGEYQLEVAQVNTILMTINNLSANFVFFFLLQHSPNLTLAAGNTCTSHKEHSEP